MKPKLTLLLIILLSLSLPACKKDNSPSATIIGKWYVAKMEIKQTSVTESLKDTTYTGNNFNTNDNFQFNKDGTALSSASAYFSIDGISHPMVEDAVNGIGINFTYNISGTVLVLNSTLMHPTPCCSAVGPLTETVILLNAKTLVLQNVQKNTDFDVTTTTYYTK